MDSELQAALDTPLVDRTTREKLLIVAAARKVANGVTTRWCTRHTRLAASCDFWPVADLNCNDTTVDAILVLPITEAPDGH